MGSLQHRARPIAALADAPPAALAERFGARLGPYLAHRARFEDDAPVTSVRIAVSESRETTFDRDIAALEEMEDVLEHLTGRLCEALVKQDRRGRTIGIKVRLDDFSTHTRARTLPQAVNRASDVGAVARELLREFAPSRPVRLLGVRVASFEAGADDSAPQLALPV